MENNSSKNSASHSSPVTASERLRNLKEAIMEKWKDRVCHEIPAAKIQSNTQLRNSLPEFMDRLAAALTKENCNEVSYDAVEEISRDHGEQRAGLPGYSLVQMLKEYKILREVIISSLENLAPITIEERDIILTFIEHGMAEASRHFEILSNRAGETNRILLDGIKDHAIIRSDTEGIINDWNAGAENILGWTKSEAIGKNASFIFTPEDRSKQEDVKEMNLAAQKGKAENKRWHVKKDGSRFYANGIMNPLLKNDGSVFGFIKVMRDDTDRLKSERQLHDFFTQSPTAMVILEGPEHFCTLANAPYEKLVKRDITGKKVKDAFSKEEVEHFIPMLDEVYKTGKAFIGRELPLTIPNEQGEIQEHWVNVNYFPHFDEFGKVKGILCDVHEVTDQIQAKKVLQKSEEQFRTLANSLPQIIWTATPDGYVDWYNDWWYKYLGLPPETKWDDEATSPMHPDDVVRTWPIWKESLTTGKTYYIEQRFKRGLDGQYRWHLVRGVPIKDENGKISKWVGANTDIHDHKVFVRKLEEERELRERFVAALSHDLRTPITSAKLSAQTLRKAYSNDEKVLRTSDRMVSNLDRVENMIQDLLDASRLSAGEKLPLNREAGELSAIVHSTIEELRHIHGNHFEIIEENNHIEGNWDTSGIRRMIENLCNNAVKYGDIGKPITVRIGSNSKETVFISVHNYGKIIPADTIWQLFEPFSRTLEAQTSGKKGWGIGLMLVKGLVDAHGGTIDVSSSEEKGTTFTVTLPVEH